MTKKTKKKTAKKTPAKKKPARKKAAKSARKKVAKKVKKKTAKRKTSKGQKSESAKRGRPKIELDEREIESLAGLGLTMQQIADVKGVDRSTIHRNFATACRRGRAGLSKSVLQAQVEEALGLPLVPETGEVDGEEVQFTDDDGNLIMVPSRYRNTDLLKHLGCNYAGQTNRRDLRIDPEDDPVLETDADDFADLDEADRDSYAKLAVKIGSRSRRN